MQIGILEGDKFSIDGIKELEKLGTVQIYDDKDLPAFLAIVEILFVRLRHKIDTKFLDMAPKLKFLCSPTTGHTHIDMTDIKLRRIQLVTLRGEREFLRTIRATPEHTVGLILALLRSYGQVLTDVGIGVWNRDKFLGEELCKNSVGIIGLGRVGYRVAKYCAAFGAKVNWCDIENVESEIDWDRMPDIKSLINASRIVVLCADHSNGDKPIIGSVEIESLNDKYFVNTARGELVDERSLLNALSEGKLIGAATDVIENENSDNRLLEWVSLTKSQNVIVTPHIAGATLGSMRKTELFIVHKLTQLIISGERFGTS